MERIRALLAVLRRHLPAYLRPDRSPEGREQQQAASTTIHG